MDLLNIKCYGKVQCKIQYYCVHILSTPRKHYFSVSGIHFYQILERFQSKALCMIDS
jgi:hypothetical protein